MPSKQHQAVRLEDYRPPAYLVDQIDLTVDLFEESCTVTSMLSCRRNPKRSDNEALPFICHGEALALVSLELNGEPVSDENRVIDDETLTLKQVPDRFELKVVTTIYPKQNKALEGLYQSGNILCTQCEAEGFRRMTYFPDRPDILAEYTTTIIADQILYPVLLSNGNLVDKGELENHRHWIKWHDPFKKPCYLFALVAGDLVSVDDTFSTRSGREVSLQIFVEKENIDKCDHAMQSLKQAMRWDENTYDREYDLDRFMIVAVNDFNAGAMENKGLNIFNSSLILAKPDTAADRDFERIMGVVAHEYFHNWTGNRVTCRDWFQLSLKEGLTIFRDQAFSADMRSAAAKRISDVNFLRTAQFAEDAGPMAHPVRPDSYIEINNFYTVTVYHKGAELIRMIHELLGPEGFFKGMALYFSRHDGEAVTIEDFVAAMEDANQKDLKQFRRWYSQAGTPEVTLTRHYQEKEQSLVLTFTQSCPPTPGQEKKEAFQIPIVLGLTAPDGNPMPCVLEEGEPSKGAPTSITLELTESTQSFVLKHLPQQPVPSAFRNFSAPVKFHHDLTQAELLFLMSHDADEFNRWDAAQQILTQTLLSLISEHQQQTAKHEEAGIESRIDGLINAFRVILGNSDMDKEVMSRTLALPGESYLGEQMEIIDIDSMHHVREATKRAIGKLLRQEFFDLYCQLHQTDASGYDAESAGIRSLKNLALEYLMTLGDQEIQSLCLDQFQQARTMTDEIKALSFIVNEDEDHRQQVLDRFYQKWQHDTVVMDMWLIAQSTSKLSDVNTIKHLMNHPVFDLKNPNKTRSLIGGFSSANLVNFHQADGEGYRFLADQVITLNSINPQTAARLLTPIIRWKRFDKKRQALMKEQLQRILQTPQLAKDVYEVVSKSLL